MTDHATLLARRASRWWSAPARFTVDAASALRRATTVRRGTHGSWLTQAPVGIRAPLNVQP